MTTERFDAQVSEHFVSAPAGLLGWLADDGIVEGPFPVLAFRFVGFALMDRCDTFGPVGNRSEALLSAPGERLESDTFVLCAFPLGVLWLSGNDVKFTEVAARGLADAQQRRANAEKVPTPHVAGTA